VLPLSNDLIGYLIVHFSGIPKYLIMHPKHQWYLLAPN